MPDDSRRMNSLDRTYLDTLKIFYDRNYTASTEAIYMHLAEIVGGLSLLASSKQKPEIVPSKYVPKAIAWWFALCGKLEVSSVERLMWSKFPGICPYCMKCPHEDIACAKIRIKHLEPDWKELKRISEEKWSDRPQTLGEWQRHFASIYPTSAMDTYSYAFGRLVEEMGELAESIRTYSLAKGNFINEAADVFAWIMKIQNLIDREMRGLGGELGHDLDDNFNNAYPKRCNDCLSCPCRCSAILAKNIGRLSEGPSESEIIGPIFTNAQSLYAIFSMTGHDSVKLPNENVISDVKLRVGRLVEFIKMNRIEEATETFHELKELSISSRDTTATTMELARAIGQQPKDEKQLVVNFLLGEESGLFANSVTQLVQTYFR